jgi:hypothetical protein
LITPGLARRVSEVGISYSFLRQYSISVLDPEREPKLIRKRYYI